jgi:hypothetical protein
MEEVYVKELASFAAFQRHLFVALGIDVAALHWTSLGITKQSGVNAIGICSSTFTMLYLSAEGSVCEQEAPSHAAFALDFSLADGSWLAEWISTATGLPLAPSFVVTAKDGRGAVGLQTPELRPDAVLVLKASSSSRDTQGSKVEP